MKIAVLIRNFSRSGGGAERYCVELSERLSINNEVHVFSQNFEKTSSLIKFHKIYKLSDKPRFLNQLLFSFLTKKATYGKFDIIHSHEMVASADVYTIHVPCFKTILSNSEPFKKLIIIANIILSPRKISYLWLEKKQMELKKSKHYIAVSNYLERNIRICYPEIKAISVACPATDGKLFIEKIKDKKINRIKNKLSLPESSFLILHVANNFKKKGLPTIIKSLNLLQNSNIHLIVVGNDKHKKKSIPKELSKNIHFFGVVKNMENLYSEVDTLIHPTLADTFGMAPLEAMSFKIPVIISNMKFCGLSEYLTESSAVILENPEDEIELAKKINLLYQDPKERTRIGQSGYKISKNISWDIALEKTQIAFNSIIGLSD